MELTEIKLKEQELMTLDNKDNEPIKFKEQFMTADSCTLQ
jgi:hypothetical protein